MDDKQQTPRLSLPSGCPRSKKFQNKAYQKNRIFQTRPKFLPQSPTFNYKNSPEGKRSHNESQEQKRTQQTTADKSRYSFPTVLSQNKKKGVRQKLDQQLLYINQVLCERKFSFQSDNSLIWKQNRIRGPTIQRELVFNYLETMYNEFQIPRFRDQWVELEGEYEEKFNFLKTQPLNSIQNERKYLNISEVERRTPKNSAYSLKSKIIDQLTPKKNQTNFFKKQKIEKSLNKSKQIPQIFRYCFICEKPILESNIEIHEQQKCPNFKQLYQMELNEIKNMLLKKIERIRKQCELDYNCVFFSQKNGKKENLQQNLAKKTLEFLSISKQNLGNKENKKKIDCSFQEVKNIFEGSYIKMYEGLKKLKWFSYMLINLEQVQNNMNKNFNKIKNN